MTENVLPLAHFLFYNNVMRQVWNKLTCLYCKNEIIQIADTILNPNIDKDLKQKILNDTWMVTKCPRCHNKVKSIYPCIYKDNSKKLIVHVKKKFEVQEEGYTQRFVNSREAFIELIRIWEDNMDDQKIMYIKSKLKENNKLIEYVACDDEYLFFKCDGTIKLVKNIKNQKKINRELMEYKADC